MSTMSVILLITLKHSFGKQRKQKDFLFVLSFHWKVVYWEGSLSGMRFSAKPLFCSNEVVHLNKFDCCV